MFLCIKVIEHRPNGGARVSRFSFSAPISIAASIIHSKGIYDSYLVYVLHILEVPKPKASGLP